MEEYCPKHPGVKIERQGRYMYAGAYCPKCSEEKAQQKQLMRQHESTRRVLQEHEENRLWDKEQERERQYLQTGLLEFNYEFQEEWASVVGLRDSFSEIWEEATQISTFLEMEFSMNLSAGELPEEHLRSAEEKFAIGSIQKALEGIESEVFRYTYNRIQRLNVAKGIGRLYRSLKVYQEKNAFFEKKLPSSGKYFLMTGVICLLMGVTCSSACGSSLDPNRTSFASVVFTWPAILFTLIFLFKFIRRQEVYSRNKKVRKILNRFTDVLTEYILGKEPGDGASPEAVFKASSRKIQNFLKKQYMKWAFENPSKSEQGGKLHTLVCVESSCETTKELKDVYDQVEKQHAYMRDKIREVGLEIHRGIRVPARMKASKIELLRCPSCGGPLADDGNKECYYCGSKFRMR